eukprot:4680242-Prymnesium_polylepis.1
MDSSDEQVGSDGSQTQSGTPVARRKRAPSTPPSGALPQKAAAGSPSAPRSADLGAARPISSVPL